MKKILLSGAVLLFATSIFAQHVQFGLKGGVNISNFNNDANIPTSSLTGFHLGGLAHIHFTKSLALQPEIVYSTQGAQFEDGTKSKVNYVNVPVLGQYMFGDGFRVQTGPQLGIFTNSKSITAGTETNIDRSNYKTTDFGWVFGASYVSHSGLGVDARYNLGLTDITPKNPVDYKNRVWQFGVFYQFAH